MEPIRFRLAPDEFAAPAVLSPIAIKRIAPTIADFTALTADGASVMANIEALLTSVSTVFRALLPGASGQRFVDRLNSEGRPQEGEPGDENYRPADPAPIDLIGQAIPVMNFLFESYGLRPTVPSLPSPSGSTEAVTGTSSDAISSTDGV